MVHGRAQFALYGVPCVVNLLGMFYVCMGAAFRPGSGVMLGFGGGLFLITAITFGIVCAARARDLGWSAATTGFGMIFLIVTGPMLLIPVGALLIMPGKGAAPRAGLMTYVGALLLFSWPWVLVFLVSQVTRP